MKRPLILTALFAGTTALSAPALACGMPDVVVNDEPIVERVRTPSPQITAELDRLNALSVVKVDALVETAPIENRACYGMPCNDADREVVEAHRAEQLQRLTVLTDALERTTMGRVASTPRPEKAIQADLAALRSLGIVQVSDLVRAQPEAPAGGYASPFAEDSTTKQTNQAANRLARAMRIIEKG